MKNNKTLIIIGIALAIPLIIVLFIVIFKSSNVMKVINVKDISKIKANELTEYVIDDKYYVDNIKVYEARDSYKLGNLNGKLLLLKGKKFRANIFQSFYVTTNGIEGIPILVQIDQYMNSFINNSLDSLGIDSDYEYVYELTGESKYSFPISLEESIYKERRTYTRNYVIDNKNYDMNFYMDDDTLVCELVRIF